ncbi:hypothetical protein [Chryseobacterium sp. Mn2064]|uniref:hypothetical protein n=1 Tax=Chryseobacterium sp. Mn2064 TaxID=3395263 RepID=UPI003BBA0A3B
MFKELLIFFRIIDEIQMPVPLERGSARKPLAKPEKEKGTKVEEKKAAEIIIPSGIVPLGKIKPVEKEKIKNFKEHTKNYTEYCLEKTSNQHMMKVSSYKLLNRNDSTETFSIQGDAFITHNEHQMIRIESSYFVKYIQQEYNPITQLNENAYD